MLNDFMRCWLEQWWRSKSGSTLCYEELVGNPPHNALGISLEEYRNSIDEFRLSTLFTQMPPNPEVKKWFLDYGHLLRHIVLTGIPRLAAAASASCGCSNISETGFAHSLLLHQNGWGRICQYTI